MITRDEVEKFLKDFHVKVDVFGIVFRDDRPKNMDTLHFLELPPFEREPIVMS